MICFLLGSNERLGAHSVVDGLPSGFLLRTEKRDKTQNDTVYTVGVALEPEPIIADDDIAFFLSRADKIPPSSYSAYRQACATAGDKQPDSKALGHLQFLYFPFL